MARACVTCGEDFDPKSRRHRYCSPACKRYRKACPWCGHCFEAKTWKVRHCSRQCASNTARTGVAELIPWASCIRCRRWFVARAGRRCCSQCPHGWIDYKPRLRPCRTCGHPLAHGRGWCGPACRRQDATWQAAQRMQERRRDRRLRTVDCDHYMPVDIFERDGYRCHLCRRRCRRDVPPGHPLSPSIDHITPVVDGGTDTLDNVATAHWRCNTAKGRRAVGDQLRLIG